MGSGGLKIWSMDELMDEREKQGKSPARVVVDMNGDFQFPHDAYYVPGEECRTHRDLVYWIAHLSGKMWFDKKTMLAFMDVVCRQNKLPLWR
jgi:hypothetical protein